MPAGRPESSAGSGAQRTTFRPPWVKDGPNPLPMPTAPWTQRNKDGTAKPEANSKTSAPADGPKKTSKITINPSQPTENGNSKPDYRSHLKETPKPTVKETTKLQSKEVKVPVQIKTEKKEPPITNAKEKTIPIQKEEASKTTTKVQNKQQAQALEPMDKAIPAKRHDLIRQDTMKKSIPEAVKKNIPDAPKMPDAPPAPPPAPSMPLPFDSKPLTKTQQSKLEQLKQRPRKRPDWAAMMKEVEHKGRSLKHVVCNDRSSPILPKTKVENENEEGGQFVYESEQPNLHNQLLKQIQGGISLKKVKTNDRSKPILEGLRKFRRQMTIEEQIQKSQSMASLPPEEAAEEVDEMDDIDKIRDDLQSTKQMLALELRNKEAQERENKRLLAKILNLEAELEKAKGESKSSSTNTADEKIINSLKSEASQARQTVTELEKKFHNTAEQLDSAKNDLEEMRKQNQLLEKKLQAALQGEGVGKRQSITDRRESTLAPPSESEPEESESESESEGEDNEEKQQKRALKEIKTLSNKLKHYKEKQAAAKRERKALQEQMKKNQAAMKEEKKKYKMLQREVDKMAALMKDDDEDDEDKEEEDEETETESESESESESSEEEESSGSEPEDAPIEKKKANLTKRSKRHENILAALKKGNYLLKTNVDRLLDDINKQKEMCQTLQQDLDSVLNDLG